MRKTSKSGMKRAKRVQRMLAGTLAAGVCFQSAQCALDGEQLGTDLVTTIVTLFVTDYVNNLFNVTPSGF